MLEVCPMCPDTSAKMTMPLADSGDVASSMGDGHCQTQNQWIQCGQVSPTRFLNCLWSSFSF